MVNSVGVIAGAAKASLAGRKKIAYLPIRLSLVYLWVGFLLFMISASALNLENPVLLVVFVAAAHLALYFGFHIGLVQQWAIIKSGVTESGPRGKTVAILVFAGAVYFALYGVAHLGEYGAAGFSDALSTALNPGEAYAKKFAIYEEQINQGRVNKVIQIVVLFGALQCILIPLLIVFWERVSNYLRILALSSIGLYMLFFLYIGTMKGVGDVLIYLAVGFLVRRSRLVYITGPMQHKKKTSIKLRLMVIIAFLAFFAYMTSAMQSRTEVLGDAALKEKGLLENVVYSLLGDDLGRGVVIALAYPTGGYSGLDKNLSTPFKWSYGLGAIPALNSYKNQYFGGNDLFKETYPARTEALTGYPALMFWATIYPWLASDLTFPGAVIFMGLVGWFMSYLWVESITYARPLSIALFGQMFLLIVYVPANNQIFQSRSSFIGFFTLLLIYIVTARGRKKVAW